MLATVNESPSKTTLFTHERKTLFLLGGSQGSLLLNNLLKIFITTNQQVSNSIQIIHQTGSYDTTNWKKFYASAGIPAITFSYSHQIKDFYLLSDLVICRAGAGTLFELLFFKKHSIIIPLVAKTTDHQVENARAMAAEHPDLFTIIEQKQVEQNPTLLHTEIIRCLQLLR